MNFRSIGRFSSHLALGLMLLAGDARGQTQKDPGLDAQWGAVHALRAGELVQVRLLKKGTVRGSILSSTETEITVAAKGGQVTTPRSDIKEVKVKRGQGGKILIGAAIGGASGVSTAAILDGALTDGNGISGSAVALFGALGVSIGAALASLRPAYKTIYKVR